MKLHLACAADAPYVPHSAATLHSALVSDGPSLVIHYLHDPGFPQSDARRLETMATGAGAEIIFHSIPPEWLAGLPLDHRFGPAMWYRIFLPDLLPEVSSVLYLDVDTLVLDRLEPLWDLHLDGYCLAGVTNVFMEYHRYRGPELGIPLEDYFNSGVLMLNLADMRETGFTQTALELIHERGSTLLWPDQDILNLLAGTRRLALHPRWNVMNSFSSHPELAVEVFGESALAEAVASPAIRHFEGPGPNKPWHLLHDRSEQRLYRQYRSATPWPHVALEGTTLKNVTKRLVADVRNRRGASVRRGVSRA